VWLLLIPADDLVFYWYHRLGHEVRLFWAAHVNHHSSTTYNLSTALRQSWTSPVFTWFFWLPLVLLGFHPLMIVVVQSISLLYQYWIHTELITRLGPLEWVMNTPSHHRVHHAVNPMYLDRNYGGIFIVWDRLFGSFEEECEQPTYGLTKNIETYNPVIIAFHEWWAIGRDVVKAETWRGRLGYIFARPGWREDGTGTTAVHLRKAALEQAEGSLPR
jgi:sterol desaturase/sphingolipid hydroxylase (fatty acid hydroxylase superfamily)